MKISEIKSDSYNYHHNLWRYGQMLYRIPYVAGLGHSVSLVVKNENGFIIASTNPLLSNNKLSEKYKDYIRDYYNEKKEFPSCELVGDFLVINQKSKLNDLIRIVL